MGFDSPAHLGLGRRSEAGRRERVAAALVARGGGASAREEGLGLVSAVAGMAGELGGSFIAELRRWRWVAARRGLRAGVMAGGRVRLSRSGVQRRGRRDRPLWHVEEKAGRWPWRGRRGGGSAAALLLSDARRGGCTRAQGERDRGEVPAAGVATCGGAVMAGRRSDGRVVARRGEAVRRVRERRRVGQRAAARARAPRREQRTRARVPRRCARRGRWRRRARGWGSGRARLGSARAGGTGAEEARPGRAGRAGRAGRRAGHGGARAQRERGKEGRERKKKEKG